MKPAHTDREEAVGPVADTGVSQSGSRASTPEAEGAPDAAGLSDEEYWERMLFISRGPTGWNIGCGCG